MAPVRALRKLMASPQLGIGKLPANFAEQCPEALELRLPLPWHCNPFCACSSYSAMELLGEAHTVPTEPSPMGMGPNRRGGCPFSGAMAHGSRAPSSQNSRQQSSEQAVVAAQDTAAASEDDLAVESSDDSLSTSMFNSPEGANTHDMTGYRRGWLWQAGRPQSIPSAKG